MQDQLPTQGAGSPGALLRQAREAAGLDLDTLAASIKVSPRKLESLEADRFDALPDTGFTRALALTVCRALKIDPAPVLALLPAPSQTPGLEQVTRGLNQPFDDSSMLSRVVGLGWKELALRPAIVAPLVLLLASAVVYLWPTRERPAVPTAQPQASSPASAAVASGALFPPESGQDAGRDDASPAFHAAPVEAADGASGAASAGASAIGAGTASAATPVPASVEAPGGAASVVAATPAAAAVAPAVAASSVPGVLVLQAREDSWVEVRDASNRVLLSRLLRAGERADVGNGEGALRVKVGNAGGTELQLRGSRVDLVPYTRDNVARLELK